MFIAMNRFKIAPGFGDGFERVWRERESYLSDVPGFRSFHLLRGPGAQDHVLYASHTVWESRADFDAWTRSEHFRAAHRDAGNTNNFYLYHDPGSGRWSFIPGGIDGIMFWNPEQPGAADQYRQPGEQQQDPGLVPGEGAGQLAQQEQGAGREGE